MMSYGIASTSCSAPIYSLIHQNYTTISPKSNFPSLFYPNNHTQLSLSHTPRPISCNYLGGPGPDENDNRTVLDAFFLGKALGEALTERVESVVGEVLSTVGRLQAEQQKQIQEFQEEVLERAKRAKEKAARDALEAQGRLTVVDTNAPASVVDEDSLSEIQIDE